MKTKSVRRLVAVTCITLSACAGSEGPTGPPPLLSALPRELTLAEQTIVAGSNSFSFGLLRRISGSDAGRNVFISPLSVSYALGMALNGAIEETHDEMGAVLGLGGIPEPEINAGYKSLIELLRGLDSSVEMQIANSVWHSTMFTVQPAYADALQTWFNASVNSRDFAAPATLTDINNWVSANTHGKIPSIIDQIDPQEIMFLINAIYFHGKWRAPFDARETRPGTFHAADGRELTVDFMSDDSDSLSFVYDQELIAANLAYGNGAFAMAVLRPNGAASLDNFIAGLSLQKWNDIRARFHAGKAMLRLPRFELEYKRQLNTDLAVMGMPRAFSESQAQFSRMITTPEQLFISRVQHRAAVTVDEVGTTAAAATAVGVGVTSAPPQLDFDRPFVFLIYEQISGTVLFLGKVVELGG